MNRFAYFILVLGASLPAAYLAVWHVANQVTLAAGTRVDQQAVLAWALVLSVSAAVFLSCRQRKRRKKARTHTIRCVSLNFRG